MIEVKINVETRQGRYACLIHHIGIDVTAITAYERNFSDDSSVHSHRMGKAKGHMEEIMVEVGRLNDYIRQYCPEVEALPAAVLMDGPSAEDMEELLRSRVAAIKATTSAEA